MLSIVGCISSSSSSVTAGTSSVFGTTEEEEEEIHPTILNIGFHYHPARGLSYTKNIMIPVHVTSTRNSFSMNPYVSNRVSFVLFTSIRRFQVIRLLFMTTVTMGAPINVSKMTR